MFLLGVAIGQNASKLNLILLLTKVNERYKMDDVLFLSSDHQGSGNQKSDFPTKVDAKGNERREWKGSFSWPTIFDMSTSNQRILQLLSFLSNATAWGKV